MKVKDLIGKPFYIMMGPHGVKGAAVETDHNQVQEAIREVRKGMRQSGTSQDVVREIHRHLANELTNMLPQIMRHGSAMDSSGEFYDREKFDNDLIFCAVYDHLANGKQIAITDSIGPRQGDKVH